MTQAPQIEMQFKQEFADGEYTFKIDYDLATELEEKTGKGIQELLTLFIAGAYSHQHIAEIVRLALIGGGTTPTNAKALVERYVKKRPITENLDIALKSLEALLFGIPIEVKTT